MKPLSNLPLMSYGSKIVDNGHLIFSTNEKKELVTKYPESEILFKKLVGSAEFIKGLERWCLYITDDLLPLANRLPEVVEKLNLVRTFRASSTEASTREMAEKPHKYYYSVHKDSNSIIIPSTSSEKRKYIPMGFLEGDTIVSNAANVIFDAEPWMLAILTSKMHMVWLRAAGGQLETRIRYSSQLCYNTFAFPNISQKIKENLNLHVFEILAEREKYPERTLAHLYDPDKMPINLRMLIMN